MILGIAIGAGVLVLLFGLPYLAAHTEQSSGQSGAGAIGVLQEIFHPTARDAEIVTMQLKERKAVDEQGEGDDPQAQ